ncbi:broad specificity phosphatase PhoE [Pseudomonas hunanensis]|uniref:Broad specificity phosphatase PhoE n=1 Tax=Pseudomonas hunanensis TaxID=1247546 RepID=A0ACC6JYZ3_9PSED|nr:broad specificity phosphatase PhoE [Pseudomonas hunanensis]
MKRVRLIRHGESAANAGAASHDHATIPLTAKGMEQARQVARSVIRAPELIVVSPFSRAQVTASFTAATFPAAALETWSIEEFTYLAPARCVNTTVAQRRGWVDQYWTKADPSHHDGEGAESFLDFVDRGRTFLDRLAAHPAQDIVAFSHGQFLNVLAWLIERRSVLIDGRAMTDWRHYEITHHVPNGCGYQLYAEQDDANWRLSHSISVQGVFEATQRQLEAEQTPAEDARSAKAQGCPATSAG